MNRRPALAIAAFATALVALATPTAAHAGPYDASPVPHTDDFRGSGAVQVQGRKAAGLTKSQAQAVRIVAMRYDVVTHDGEPSARIRTTLQRVLPSQPNSYRQVMTVSFDEERALRTNLATGRTKFVSTSGGGPIAGCHRQSVHVDGRVLTQWVPLRCLLTDTSEMGSSSTLTSLRTHRVVSSHGKYPGIGPFLRWRS